MSDVTPVETMPLINLLTSESSSLATTLVLGLASNDPAIVDDAGSNHYKADGRAQNDGGDAERR